jgi:hypothetical protein
MYPPRIRINIEYRKMAVFTFLIGENRRADV